MPDLVVTSITAPPTAVEGSNATFEWVVRNDGSTPATGTWTDRVAFSRDGNIGSDILIGVINFTGTLQPGETYTQTLTTGIPSGVFGNGFIVVETDTGNALAEGDGEGNNALLDDAAINITATFPDVYVDPATILVPASTPAGTTINVAWSVSNRGGVAANYTPWGGVYYRMYLSDDTTAGDADDVLLVSDFFVSLPGGNAILDPGESQPQSRTVTLPQDVTGVRYIVIETDLYNLIPEGPSGEANNFTIDDDAIDILASFADLVVTEITVAPTVAYGTNFTVSWTVQNQGTISAPAGSWRDRLGFSNGTTWNGSSPNLLDVARPSSAASLAPGASYTQTRTVSFGSDYAASSVYFFVRTDLDGNIAEGPTGETNNITRDDATTTVQLPDVQVDPASIVVPASTPAGSTITVNWNISNAGPGTANYTPWGGSYYRIYLSDDTVAGDADDVLVQSDFFLALPGGNSVLDPGESQPQSRTFTLPQATTGPRYIVIQCDYYDLQPEGTAGEANNLVLDADALNIEAAFADLVVTDIAVAPTLAYGTSFTVSWTVQNQGTVAAPAGSWRDRLGFSNGTTWNGSNPNLRDVARPSGAASLAPGASYTQTQTVTFGTDAAAPTIYFFVRTDLDGNVPEGTAGEANNITRDDATTAIELPDVQIDPATIVVPASTPAGTSITVNWSIRNAGPGTADYSPWGGSYYRIYLSDDTVAGDADDLLVQSDFFLSLPGASVVLSPGESAPQSRTFNLPQTTTGLRYVLIQCDYYDLQPEGTAGEANNLVVDADVLDIQAIFADLVVTDITVAPTVAYGTSFSISWTVTNQGTIAAPAGSWRDRVGFSNTTTWNGSSPNLLDVARPAGAASLAPGASYTQTQNITFGTDLAAASVYFFVRTDLDGNVTEGPTGEANNITRDDVTTTVNLPDVTVDPATISVPSAIAVGGSLTVNWSIRNNGPGTANYTPWGGSYYRIYLSTDTVAGNGDDVLVQSDFFLSMPGGNAILDPNESQPQSRTFTLAQNISGQRYVVIWCDYYDLQPEGVAGEANNRIIDQQPINITFLPNLIVPQEGISVPSNVSIGQEVLVSWTIRNSGSGVATGSWTDEFLLSTDRVVGNDIALGGATFTGTLGAGESTIQSRTITIPPEATGTFYFLVRTDVANTILETNENDNFGFDIETVTGSRPDLSVQMVSAPTSAVLGQQITITWRDANAGPGEAVGSWFDRVVLSSDATFGNGDDRLLSDLAVGGPIAAGAFASRTLNVAIPSGIPSGVYTVFVRADATDAVTEVSEANNTGSAATTITIGGADLVPSTGGTGVPSLGVAGRPLSVQWTETNNGDSAIAGNWNSRVVLSFNTIAGDGDDIASTVASATGPLNAGASLLRSADLQVPASARGPFNVIVTSDSSSQVGELSELNNTLVLGQTNVDGSDLLVESTGISVPASASTGQTVAIGFSVRNDGPRDALPTWSDRVVLSLDEIAGNGDDAATGSLSISQALAANTSAARSINLTVPPGASGSYFVLAVADVSNQVAENNENNNVRTLGSIIVGAPDLVSEQSAGVQPSSSSAGQQVFVQWIVRNTGVQAVVANWSDRLVLSANQTFGDGDDTFLVNVPASGPLSAGDTLPRSATVTVPNVAAGDYFVLARADVSSQVPESNENNNAAVVGTLQIGVADLVVTAVSAPSSGVTGSSITVSWTVANQGNATAFPTWTDRVFISTNDTLDGSDPQFGTAARSTLLAPASNYNATFTGALPATEGQYWFIVQADGGNNVAEGATGDANNTRAFGPVTVSFPPNPDLVVTSLTAPTSATAGDSITITYTVTNEGDQPAVVNWQDAIYLSNDAVLDGGDEVVRLSPANQAPLAPEASYSFTRNITLPVSLTPATKFVIVRTDQASTVTEQAENNNTRASASIAVAAAPSPDLVASGATAPSTAVFGQPIDVAWSVANQGTADAQAPWSDAIYLSTDATFNTTDRLIGSRAYSGASLVSGQPGYNASTSVTLPLDQTTTPGTYYIIVRADGFSGVDEPNENNNVSVFGPVTIALPDLPNIQVTSVSAPASAEVGLPFSVTFRLANVGALPATGSWLNEIRLVAQSGPAQTPIVAVVAFTGTIEPGQTSAVQTATFALPDLGNVALRARVITNVDRTLLEGNTADNTGDAATQSLYIRPDLRAVTVSGPATGVADSSIAVQYTGMNEGPAGAIPFWIDAVYLSLDNQPGNDILLGTRGETSALPNGAGYTRNMNIPVPSDIEGTYWLILEIDRGDRIIEGGAVAANNFAVSMQPIEITQPPRPNLVVDAVSTPAPGLSGGAMEVTWTVRNAGAGPANGFWTDRVFVSTDAVLDASDVRLNDFASPMALTPGQTYSLTRTVTYPSVPGDYYVIVQTDANTTLNEGISGGENDNARASASPTTVATFVATAQSAIDSAPAGTSVPISGVATVEGFRVVAPNVPVVVRVATAGFERRINATTDEMGNYAATFTPGPTEGGRYDISAGPAHVSAIPASDSFSLWALIPSPINAFVTANPGIPNSTQLTLRNPGNLPQTGLAVQITGAPAGVDVQAIINPGGGSTTIGANATVPVAVQILANQEITTPFVVNLAFESAQGGAATFPLNLRVLPAEAALAAVPDGLTSGRLSVNVQRGVRTFAQFQVENVGTGPTGPLNINLPTLSWMTLATPAPLPSLGPGQRASIVLQLDPPSDTPLASYSGAVGVQGSSTGIDVPFRFNVVSTGVGDLRITATDEFTYYAEGAPRVQGASVTVRAQGTNTIVAAGLTDALGEVLFEGLTEAYYDLEVRAADHGTFRSSLFVGGGDVTDVEAFMPRQLISYNWSVTPIDFQDIYRITIQATFATQVPAPVVVLEPTYVNLEGIPLPTQINYTITNYGLITANDVRFTPGTSPDFEIVPLVDSFGDLPGNASVTVPALILPRTNAARSATRSGCSTAVSFACSDLPCGDQVFTYCGPSVTTSGSGCGGGGGGGGGGGIIDGGGWGGGPGGGGGGGEGGEVIIGPPIVSQPVACDPCVIKCAFSGLGCVPGLGCGAGLGGCPAQMNVSTTGNAVSSVAGCIGAGVNCAVNLTPLASQLSCLCSVLRDCALCQFTGVGPTNFIPCSPGDLIAAAGAAAGAAIDGLRLGAGAAFVAPTYGSAPVDYFLRIYYAYIFQYALLKEVYGDVDWILVDSTTAPAFTAFSNAWIAAANETGPSGVRISETERTALFASPRPPAMDQADVEAFVERWNRSHDYYAQGIYTASQVPAGWDTNFIDFELMRVMYEYGQEIEIEVTSQGFASINDAFQHAKTEYENYAQAMAEGSDRGGGFENLADAMNYAKEVVVADTLDAGAGVCAQVRIEIDQTLAVTRTAFRATLEIENESSNPLEGIAVNVIIKDASGNNVNNRFGIFPPELGGALTGVDGMGSLPGNQTGNSSWTILPTNEAAPLEPVEYFVSGTLSYTTAGEVATVPLYPVTITVLPDPSLQLSYFLETIVYADDPFTPELEPSIPFSLGLLVKNNGSGVARNLTITSSQPEIVENERGLLIDFDIIGTQVGTQQISPSLTVNLGDIGPTETNVARWLMISTLQGEFTRFTATYEHLTGLNDPRLSLIESVDIFGLNHVVRDVRPAADELPDFLTDDFPDPRDLPDTVHLSNGNVEEVASDVNGSATPVPGQLRATIDAQVESGWNYIRVDDPFDASYRLSRVERHDGTPLLMPENAWQTSRIDRLSPGSPVERFVHIFDRGGTGEYTLFFDPDSLAPLATSVVSTHQHGSNLGEVALEIDPANLFTEPRGPGISKLVYTFNEPIDAATFSNVTVQVDGFNLNGQTIDLSGVAETVTMTTGDTVGVVEFVPPLPSLARYCVQLVGVQDRSGNPLAGPAQRIDIAHLPGDASGDGRVSPTDVGGVGSLISSSEIDRNVIYQVRSDMNLDGVVSSADLQVVTANARREARSVPNPCLVLAAGAQTPGKDPNAISPEGPTLFDSDATPPTASAQSDEGTYPSANNPETPSRVLAYEFEGRQRMLAFDDTMLAIYDPSGGRDVPALLDQYGVNAAGVSLWPVDGWWAARLPSNLAQPDARRSLENVLVAAGLVTSPVLRSEDGAMLAPAPAMLVKFNPDVPTEWAGLIVEQTAGIDARSNRATRPGYAGVESMWRIDLGSLSGQAVLELASALTKRREIEFAEPVFVFVTEAAVAAKASALPQSILAESSFAELAVIGGENASDQAAAACKHAASLMAGRNVSSAVLAPLGRDGTMVAGSTAAIIEALHHADARGVLVTIFDVNLPYGSKAISSVTSALASKGVALLAAEPLGLSSTLPGVTAPSPDADAARTAAFALAFRIADPEARREMAVAFASDPSFVLATDVNLGKAKPTDPAAGLRQAIDVLQGFGGDPADVPAADLNTDGAIDMDDLTRAMQQLASPASK